MSDPRPTRPTTRAARVTATDLRSMLHGAEAVMVLDVRTTEAFVGAEGHIDGASPFPLDRLRTQLSELEGLHDRPFVLVCEDGTRAEQAAELLVEAGFESVHVLQGGMRAWTDAGLPVRGSTVPR